MTSGEFDELADDVEALGLDTFGESITYHPAGGADITTGADGSPLRGQFRAASAEAVLDTEVSQLGVLPRLWVHVVDIPTITPKQDHVTVHRLGQRFTVKDERPNGYTTVELTLSRGVSLP